MAVPFPLAALRPAEILSADSGLRLLKIAIFSAVLESRTEMVTKTPRGRRSVGLVGFQVEDQPGVPVGEVGLP